MKKRLLFLIVVTFTIMIPTSFQNAEAVVPTCGTPTLLNTELFVSAGNGNLYKVDTGTGDACRQGRILTTTDLNQNPQKAGLACDDLALHPSGKLYAICNKGTILYELVKTPVPNVADPGVTAPEIQAKPIGTLNIGGVPVPTMNSLEIDSSGVAYSLSGLNPNMALATGGKFVTINLNNAVMTLRTDFGNGFQSAGDLAVDESIVPNDMFATIKCIGAAVPCGDPNNDALYRIDLESDTLTFLKELAGAGGDGAKGLQDVFAMEVIGNMPNLCFLTMNGNIFETDKLGNRVTTKFAIGAQTHVGGGLGMSIPAFGATANFVGGSLVMINTMALIGAGIEMNAAWLTLLMISGVAVISYQFTGKTDNKKRKKILKS